MGMGELLAIGSRCIHGRLCHCDLQGAVGGAAEPKHLLSAGLWFGGAQALMTLLGYFLGNGFSSVIESLDHWISFALLAAIGAHMVRESRGACPEDGGLLCAQGHAAAGSCRQH